MPGIHKNPTISFRPSKWQRKEIDARVLASGMKKKEFYTRACIYARIVVVGKRENVQLILEELKRLRTDLLNVANQFMEGKVICSKEEWKEQVQDYLAVIIAIVGIIEGATYLFKEDEHG